MAFICPCHSYTLCARAILWHVCYVYVRIVTVIFGYSCSAHFRISVAKYRFVYNGFSSFTLKKTDKLVEI